MRRSLLAILSLLAVVVLVAPPGSAAVTDMPRDLTSARQTDGEETTTTVTRAEIPESGGIIPKPNSGVEPEDAGDRGGSLQSLLFFSLLGAVVLMGALVYRQSAKARQARGF